MENQQIEIRFPSGAVAHWKHDQEQGQHMLYIGSVLVAKYLELANGKRRVKPVVDGFVPYATLTVKCPLKAQAACAKVAEAYHNALMEVPK